MTRRRSPSPQTTQVLATLSQSPLDWHHGYDLMTGTGLRSGTLYPILMRLCDQGMLEAKWVASAQRGRPPRHAYRITSAGLALVRDLLAEHHAPRERLKEATT